MSCDAMSHSIYDVCAMYERLGIDAGEGWGGAVRRPASRVVVTSMSSAAMGTHSIKWRATSRVVRGYPRDVARGREAGSRAGVVRARRTAVLASSRAFSFFA